MTKKQILDLLRIAATKKTYEYTSEMNEAIVKAANSKDHALQEQAWITMHTSLRAYEDDFLKKMFGVYRTTQGYEDYLHELFLVIMLDLKKWDPKKGAPTTHFQGRFKKACIKYRNGSSTLSSTHYEAVYTDIKKATEALAQEGVYAPSQIDFRNYLNAHGKNYSEQTISKCLDQVKELSSYEAGKETSDPVIANPIDFILRKELTDEIKKIIASLEPQHRLILEICCRVYRESDCDKGTITTKKIAEEFRRLVGPVSDEWIKNVRDAAERDFKRKYQRYINSKYKPHAKKEDVYTFRNVDSRLEDEDARVAFEEYLDQLEKG